MRRQTSMSNIHPSITITITSHSDDDSSISLERIRNPYFNHRFPLDFFTDTNTTEECTATANNNLRDNIRHKLFYLHEEMDDIAFDAMVDQEVKRSVSNRRSSGGSGWGQLRESFWGILRRKDCRVLRRRRSSASRGGKAGRRLDLLD